ncbi:MAG: histidine triad nucleotide-binding protein [Christensenellales bacterium]|jgi:histidine triad (HIT) family protein
MTNCVFCGIVKGDIPSTKVYEDDHVIAFRDINPQAPVHVLIVPRAHIGGLDGLEGAADAALAACLRAAHIIAKQEGIAGSGYRLAANCGAHACQTVGHLHFHLLGGRQLTGEMG